MTQQEIKANMTQGTWVVSPSGWSDIEFGVYDKEKYAYGTFVIGSCNSNFYQLGICNTLAITHAINNTYGKGINPESVGDMFNALQVAQKYFESTGPLHLAKDIEDIIKNATL